MLEFEISTKENLVGKTNISDQLGTWPTVTMTPAKLAEWAYRNHKGYCHGVFDNDRYEREPGDYKTARANAFFLRAEVVTIDIDAKDFFEEPFLAQAEELVAASQLEKLLENEFIKRHCFLIVPSSGQILPQKPNWHLSFALSEPITSPDIYRLKALQIASHIGVPTDHQTCKAAQLTAGTLFKDHARHMRGYRKSDIYINDDAERIDVATLEIEKPAGSPEALASAYSDLTYNRSETYSEGDYGNKRVQAHFSHSPAEREAVVLECLAAVLPTLGSATSFDLWNKVWMSAHHGSGTKAVRDFILDSPYPVWSDGDKGRRAFALHWDRHITREAAGTTVATLFYLAGKAGWLDATGYEIDIAERETISVQHIADWLASEPEVPTRVVLQSQTGTGKTETLIKLYERLNHPKTVVFVPTIKLAVELASKLQKAGLPVTLYIDTKTNAKRSHEEFVDAQVLVTTLQSFTTIGLRKTHSMAVYGLVYVEESDQLISQFSRGGGSGLFTPSHVTREQSRSGFAALKDALEHSGHVWLVDATMTRVTWELAKRFSPTAPRFIFNEQVRRKADVFMIEDKGEAFGVIQNALMRGERVVVPCDTAAIARTVVSIMTTLGLLKHKKVLLLTKDTEHLAETRAFMADVEAGAAQYDLVVYNSVMASGVSIAQTTPDTVVQLCHYLTPRANLQILNRYRSQKKVYVWYEDTEGFYGHTAKQVTEAARSAFELEGSLTSVVPTARSEMALFCAELAAYSVGDENMQRRSPKHFYALLLKADGRRVIDIEGEPTDIQLDAAIEREKKLAHDRKSFAFNHWRAAQIIDSDHQPEPDATELEIHAGRLKARVLALCNQTLPVQEAGDGELMEEFFAEHDDIAEPDRTFDRWVAEIVTDMSKTHHNLDRLIDPKATISRAERMLSDAERATTTNGGEMAEVEAVMLTRRLFPDLDHIIPPEQFVAVSGAFVASVSDHREVYEHIFENGRYSLSEMEKRYEDLADRAYYTAKALMSRIGLKLERPRTHTGPDDWEHNYRVANVKMVQRFIDWRFTKKPVDLTDCWESDSIEAEVALNRETMAEYVVLPEQERDRIDARTAVYGRYSRWRDIVNEGDW